MKEPKNENKKDDSYMGLSLAIGLLFGVAMGIATDSLALWIGVGLALGAGGGSFIKPKKE